jgi:TRAP-type C4-dicarboxylate transport system substrate-binding protein
MLPIVPTPTSKSKCFDFSSIRTWPRAARRFEAEMLRYLKQTAAAALILVPAIAAAEPIKLKLAFFSSDRTHLYRAMVKPFVDAVNAAGTGRVEIEVYFSGTLGGDLAKQSQLLLDGTADIAHVAPSYERSAFPDSSVIELPGLYRDGREATRAYTNLVATGMIRDFKNYFVIGTFASEPESIHSRPRVASLTDLKGMRIRANNETEGAILKKLGVTPAAAPINQTADAISSGKIDGALAPPVPMIEFGIGRVAPNHYFLKTSCVPLSLLMSRKKFDSLPDDIQAIIRQYSGDWLADNYIRINNTSTETIMTQLESDPHRSVVFPSKADTQTADAVYKSVVDAYVANNPHSAELVDAARAAVAKLRGGG